MRMRIKIRLNPIVMLPIILNIIAKLVLKNLKRGKENTMLKSPIHPP